jgi:hypothetical protein
MGIDMKLIHKISTASLATATYLTLVAPVFAQPVDTCPQGGNGQFNKLCSSFGADSFGRIIGTAITAIFVVAIILALFFLIWGGIKWILSGGDKAKVEAARGTIIAAIVGLIITFLAYFVLNLILTVFGLGSVSTLQLPQF